VSPDNLREWRLPDDSGLLLAHVHQGGPAMQAGLAAGDVIYAVQGEPVDSVSSLATALGSFAAGDTVTLECWHQGAPMKAVARLAAAEGVFQRACGGGDAGGCFSMGVLLAEAPDVDRSPGRAAAFLRKACNGGSAEACVRVAAAHRDGSLGLSQSPLLAATLYEKACQGRAAAGCLGLAGLYATPGGALESQEQAAELYQRACGWHVAEACHEMALRYASGNGVVQDAQRSRSLHRVACDLGSQESCDAAP
jgi:TPR repeat protein